MIENYIKTALRNLRRNKFYSVLNIGGLAIGTTCCILILLYVQDELSWDRFHDKANRICRIAYHFVTADRGTSIARTAYVQGPMLKQDYPEVENYVRFSDYMTRVVRYEDTAYSEERFIWVDNSVFDIFSFNLIKGNPREALTKPNTVVLTEDLAVKYFGTENPIGKGLRVGDDALYTVTGVVENIPANSHIRPNFLASFATLSFQSTGDTGADLSRSNYYTYILLKEGTDYKALEQKIDGFTEKYYGPMLKRYGASARYELQPLTSIYLHSKLEYELGETGEMVYVWLLSAIGLSILLLACLNFINLSTARAANRAKEVGLRKVVGAQRMQLITQFIGESMILTCIATLLSLFLVFLTLPIFNGISGKSLALSYMSNPVFLLGFLGLFAIVSLIGGSYPGFFLSAFRPIEAIQGRLRRGAKHSVLRIALVSFQFTVSIVLIISTLIVNRQLNYIRNVELGYDKDNIIALTIRNETTQKKHEALRNGFMANPNILSVSASGSLPLGISGHSAHHIEGQPMNERTMLYAQIVDEYFIDTYNMKIAKGRNFSKDFPTDPDKAVIINEAAAKEFGWHDDPLGKEIGLPLSGTPLKTYKVVGVVKDYHFQSLHKEIRPVVLYCANPNRASYYSYYRMSLRVSPENIQDTLRFLRSKWREFDPQFPLEFTFLNDQYDALYRTEERLGKLFGYFTALAVLIGCLGLFGLSSYSAEQRTKETGIRKVLGATTSNVTLLLVREFTKWVLLAALIAWPVGYYIMNTWLQNFAYRIRLGVDTFVLSALLALAIAILTVTYQAVKAAVANPVDSLKYE